jgi:hypothetical protein
MIVTKSRSQRTVCVRIPEKYTSALGWLFLLGVSVTSDLEERSRPGGELTLFEAVGEICGLTSTDTPGDSCSPRPLSRGLALSINF